MKHIISKLAAAALLLPGIAGWGAEPFRLGACFHFGSSASGDVEANLNPAKWVCVEAEKTAVLVHNCTVLLVMSWSDVTDALTANFNALWS